MLTVQTFKSSSSDKTYTVQRADDGSLVCDCMGWRFNRHQCIHTKQVAGNVSAKAHPATRLDAPVAKAPAAMLASAMTEAVSGAAFDARYAGWHLEEKHDGHRIVVTLEAGKARAFNRSGDRYERTLPDAMKAALSHLTDGIYDGELVTPGGKSWDVAVIGAHLVFVIFDLLEVAGKSLTGRGYEDRREALLEQLRKLPAGQQSVSTVESHPASWAQVQAIWARGGEGAILKRPGSTYRAGHRSPEWVKVKEQKAAVLTLTGFGTGKNGPHSVMKLRDDAGVETTVKTLGNAMLAEIARDPQAYIGRRVVVSYQLKTPSGRLRHPQWDHFA